MQSTPPPSPSSSPDDAIARVGDLAAAAADTASQPGSAVVPSGIGEAEAVKAGMVERRAALLRQKQEVEQAAAEAKALVQAKVKEMERKLAEQLALLQPALDQLAVLSDGVDALNIYLGRYEEIITLLEGERAPADTPVSVRQLVLAMDEESLLFVDRDGMDFRDIDAFADWLSRDPSHLDTLLPEAKGIVALIPRRSRKNYADPWLQNQADAANAQTYWLIRNGAAAFLTSAPFTVGRHTVPTPKEFTDMFIVKGRFGQPDRKLEPGSEEWMKAEKQADQRTRHYMKVALLLQGLLDRTAVLHPHDGVSFLDQAQYDAGRVRVVLDGENALTDGRPSFRAWRSERVAAMHSGMRVIGAFSSRMQLFDTRDHGAQVRPKGSSPQNMTPYNVRASSRAYYDWEFTFERTEKIFDEESYTWRLPKTKATGYLSNSDGWWLPLDAITEDEIRYYMGSRTQRHEYLDMIPALRAALAVKEAEHEAEAPFRAALIDAIARETALDSSDVLADELITWYKTANQHHRALTGDDAKAAKVILAEARRRARGDSKDAERVAALLAKHPTAMAVARRSSDFIVAVPEQRTYAGATQNVFCRLHIYTLSGALKDTREWVTLTRAQVARWTILHADETWDGWSFNPDLQHYYTDDELTCVIDYLRSRYPDMFLCRVEPGAKGTLGANGQAYAWNGDKGLRALTFYVKRNRDSTVRVDESYSGMVRSSHNWDAPAWRTRWSGEAKPDSNLWVDAGIEALAFAEWQAHVEASKRDRNARDRAISVASKLERVWEAAAEEQVKARFVEDFGDATLWEGHRKALTLPRYPHRWEGDAGFRERLTDLYMLDPEVDVTGLTVAEILALADEQGAPRRGTDPRAYSRVAYPPVDESLLPLVPLPQK